jgi:outer membrane receptor protein involved in Fe transport
VPGYTAVASNPDSGLFRGNASLGRERSDNFEAGGEWRIGDLQLEASVFHRRDDDLVDWTYSRSMAPLAARTANNVDIRTTGIELLVRGRWSWLRWVAGYTWLTKREEYGLDEVDASFYALNYPRHRATLALIAKPHPTLELRADHELRDQAPNVLRHGRDRVVLASARVIYKSPAWRGLVVTLAADNLYDLGFQEIPGVPGARRRASVGASYLF